MLAVFSGGGGGGGSVEGGELGTKRKLSRRAVRGLQFFYSFCGI